MRITENEFEERKRRIIYNAYELFCDKGIDEISIAKIAKNSMVGLNSVVRYFGNNAKLVQCTQLVLWQQVTSCILEERKRHLEDAKDGLEEVTILLAGFNNLYQNHARYILFARDYKHFLLHNNIVLSQQQQSEVMSPIKSIFISSLKKGHEDGSIDTSRTEDEQFFTLWGVLRGYVEEMIVYERIYDGDNPWRKQFSLALDYMVKSLSPKI